MTPAGRLLTMLCFVSWAATAARGADAPPPASAPSAPSARELPADARESAVYKQTLAQRDALKARADAEDQALRELMPRGGGPPPSDDPRVWAIDRQLLSLGADAGKSQPPQANMARIRELLAERERLSPDPLAARRRARDEIWSELSRLNDRLLHLELDLKNIRNLRAWRPAEPVTVTQLTAAPDRYEGKLVRLTDVTLVAHTAGEPTPFDGRAMRKDGTVGPVGPDNPGRGRWCRLTFLEPDGTRGLEAYEQDENVSNQGVPGTTADIYARLVRTGNPARPVLACQLVFPHGTWSGPPAPGFVPEPVTKPTTRPAGQR